jgi:hypothetical protein
MVSPTLASTLLPHCHTKSRFGGNVNICECKDDCCVFRRKCGFYDR